MGHIWFRFPSILPKISPQGHPHSAREVRRPTKLFIVPARQRRSARGVGDFPRGRPPRFFLGGGCFKHVELFRTCFLEFCGGGGEACDLISEYRDSLYKVFN